MRTRVLCYSEAKCGDGVSTAPADERKQLMNRASKQQNSYGVLFLGISQMLMFFWTDIKDGFILPLERK